MDHAELNQQRAAVWLRPVHSIDDAREFLSAVGFCLIYPVRPPLLAPTFIGAVLGTDHDLPTAVKAAVDPRTQTTNEFVARLLKEKSAFEISYANQGSLLVSAAEFPYAFALLGDRNLKQPPSVGVRGEKSLLRHTFEHLQKGPLTEQELLERLGKSISEAALARALHELWSHLRVVRIDLRADGSPVWQVLYDWAPELVKRGIQISTPEALSALLSRYLTTVIAAEPREIEEFFGNLTPRSKVSEVVRALLQAREIESVQIGGKRMIALTGAILEQAPIPHPAGEAPMDLHDSHRHNEQRRHKPPAAQWIRPPFSPGQQTPSTPDRESRPASASKRPWQRTGPDRPSRDTRSAEGSEHRSDRPRPGGKDFGRPKQRFGRPERGGASRPSRGFKPGDRSDRKFPPRDRSDRPEGGSQQFGRPAQGFGGSGQKFGRPERGGLPRPSRGFKPGDRPDRKFPPRDKSNRSEAESQQSGRPTQGFGGPGKKFGRPERGGPSRPSRGFKSGDRPDRKFPPGDRSDRPERGAQGFSRPQRGGSSRPPRGGKPEDRSDRKFSRTGRADAADRRREGGGRSRDVRTDRPREGSPQRPSARPPRAVKPRNEDPSGGESNS